jgi:hypothetical protein
LLGDISNTLVTAPLLREASMPAQIFYELLRLQCSDAESMTREPARRPTQPRNRAAMCA